MAELKTKKNNQDVNAFLNTVKDECKRQDCFKILELMEEITNSKATMWGDAIIGFGSYHYKYASGREGDWFLTGFSPRKQNITIYCIAGFEKFSEQMNRLGKYKTGKSCLYIKKLADIDRPVLSELIKLSVTKMNHMT